MRMKNASKVLKTIDIYIYIGLARRNKNTKKIKINKGSILENLKEIFRFFSVLLFAV